MSRSTRQRILVPIVVLTVVLAGCAGGGGGGGGGDGGGVDSPTATATPTTAANDGAGDGGATTTSPGGTTATPTESDATATPTDSGGTATPTKTATTTSDGSATLSVESHAAALREAGSYTLRVNFTAVISQGEQVKTGTVRGTQKSIVGTNEGYAKWVFEYTGGNTIEYYRPPNSDTVLARFGQGQTREVPASQALFFNFTTFTAPGRGQTGGFVSTFSKFREAGTGTTDLGPAKKYVIDSVDALPESALGQYDKVKSVEFQVWVDKDTGIVARYDYRAVVVQKGEELTIRATFEIQNLGSTTVDKPEWAP